MQAVLNFLKGFEPLILAGFDNQAIPELEQLVAQAKSPDVKVMLEGLVQLVKYVGDKEIPKLG